MHRLRRHIVALEEASTRYKGLTEQARVRRAGGSAALEGEENHQHSRRICRQRGATININASLRGRNYIRHTTACTLCA